MAELCEEFDSAVERIEGIAGEPDDFDQWAVKACWELWMIRISSLEGPPPPPKYRGTARATWSGLSPTQIGEAFDAFAEHLGSLGFETTPRAPGDWDLRDSQVSEATSTVRSGRLMIVHNIDGWLAEPGDIHLEVTTPCYMLTEIQEGEPQLPADPGHN